VQVPANKLRLAADARRPAVWHRGGVTIDPAADPAAALQRFADALNHARDPARLRTAVTDEVRLDRHAPGERATAPIAESFAGVVELERWFARMPGGVQFALAGAAWAEPDGGWGVEYAYHAGDFHHGGIWIARLAGDGRIARLSHHPFALRDAPGPPGAPHAHGGGG
jgi:hypothetical protein